MAESSDMTWKLDNKFIPIYQDLKWFERDRLETWYRSNKCEEFLENTDFHFKNRKIINFDMIKNDISDDKTKQYQQTDHDEIERYPKYFQEQIMSSIFGNENKKDMNIKKRTAHEHFSNKKKAVGRGKFLKKYVDDMTKNSISKYCKDRKLTLKKLILRNINFLLAHP